MDAKKQEKPLNRIQQTIIASNINPQDQNDLLVFLPALPEKLLEDLAQLFENDPKTIKEFNENFKSKVNILINGRDQWTKMIANEESRMTHYDPATDEYNI